MELQNTSSQPTPEVTTSAPKKSQATLYIILGVIGGLVVLGGIIAVIVMLISNATGSSSSSSAATLFYDTLSNASQQTKVHFAAETTRYKNEAAKAANKIDKYNQSLAEFDTKTKQYSAVYAYDDTIIPSNGRCVQNKEYKVTGYLYKDFAAARTALNTPSTELMPQSAYNKYGACTYDDFSRNGLLSDGVIPLGFTSAQSKDWLTALQAQNAFSVKDEGTATYKGQTGRKISFALNKGVTCEDLYFAQQDGTTGTHGGLNSNKYLYEETYFSSSNTTSLKGFYIIDEKTKLPIYSEMQTVAIPGLESDAITAKQHYSFPTTLTMTTSSVPEEL